jgi:ATP-binding cassette subfamily G (WHITE) protein 2 (SNQ2)
MRRELTQLSKTRTSKSTGSNPPTSGLRRHISRQSGMVTNNETEPDVEAQVDKKPTEDGGDGDFELGDFLKDGHFEKRQEGRSAKKVGIIYKNLHCQGGRRNYDFCQDPTLFYHWRKYSLNHLGVHFWSFGS